MRLQFIPLALLLGLAPAAQAHDQGRHHREHFRGRHFCSEAPRWEHGSRWEARHRWEARERWEARRRCEDEGRHRRESCAPWEREAFIRQPAPTFHVRIQLP